MIKSFACKRTISPNRVCLGLGFVLLLSGCSTLGGIPSSGPTTANVARSGTGVSASRFPLIDVTEAVARRSHDSQKMTPFSEAFGGATAVGSIVGQGDVLEISIWEAPPATLFAMPISSAAGKDGSGLAPSSVTSLPDQMVGDSGAITVPFAGQIRAAEPRASGSSDCPAGGGLRLNSLDGRGTVT